MSNGQSINKNDFVIINFSFSKRKALALVLDTKPGYYHIVYVAGTGTRSKPHPFWISASQVQAYQTGA